MRLSSVLLLALACALACATAVVGQDDAAAAPPASSPITAPVTAPGQKGGQGLFEREAAPKPVKHLPPPAKSIAQALQAYAKEAATMSLVDMVSAQVANSRDMAPLPTFLPPKPDRNGVAPTPVPVGDCIILYFPTGGASPVNAVTGHEVNLFTGQETDKDGHETIPPRANYRFYRVDPLGYVVDVTTGFSNTPMRVPTISQILARSGGSADNPDDVQVARSVQTLAANTLLLSVKDEPARFGYVFPPAYPPQDGSNRVKEADYQEQLIAAYLDPRTGELIDSATGNVIDPRNGAEVSRDGVLEVNYIPEFFLFIVSPDGSITDATNPENPRKIKPSVMPIGEPEYGADLARAARDQGAMAIQAVTEANADPNNDYWFRPQSNLIPAPESDKPEGAVLPGVEIATPGSGSGGSSAATAALVTKLVQLRETQALAAMRETAQMALVVGVMLTFAAVLVCVLVKLMQQQQAHKAEEGFEPLLAAVAQRA